MNVFIIGATGYIGRAVTARVLNAGHRVTALVRSEASASRLPPGDVPSSLVQWKMYKRSRKGADEGEYIARVHLEGNFPGGTVDLHYRFTVDGDSIRRLEIAP
jgi:nucleoside-diphosphate-sugar epimerase